jgi:hypothetical protein
MSKEWWSLGEHSGYEGGDLTLHRIECAFCSEAGNFELEVRKQRNSKAKNKSLNYDIYKCNACGNLTMVFWSSSGSLHDYHQVPWPRETKKYPEHWPAEVGRYWMQAQRSIETGNWDAAALMARSSLQLLLRHEKAEGGTLVKEIDDLAKKGLIPPVVKEWAHNLRVLGNEAAHPQPGASGVTEKDARHVVKFLRVLLTVLQDLPHDIKQFTGGKKKA